MTFYCQLVILKILEIIPLKIMDYVQVIISKRLKRYETRVSYIYNRYNRANKKYLKSFDSKQESKHLMHLDANNLYVYATSKFLLRSTFKRMDPKKFEWNKYTRNSSKGCAPKVDFGYPKNYVNYIMVIL